MAEAWESERRLAMLIDGDNAQHHLLEQMLEEASRYGSVTIRRAYGDWTESNMAYWRPAMLAHAIQPVQQWRYTVGKNATDSTLIIDAMDILYSGTVQGFCIVSSDSDYTRLSTRIREAGLFVMGLGRKLTPEAFIKACNVFVFVENLVQIDDTPQVPREEVAPVRSEPNRDPESQPPPVKKAAVPIPPKVRKNLTNLLQRAIDTCVQEDGWTRLAALGDALRRLDPSFDSRTYGHKSLLALVQSMPEKFIVKGINPNGPSSIYIRPKDNSSG